MYGPTAKKVPEQGEHHGKEKWLKILRPPLFHWQLATLLLGTLFILSYAPLSPFFQTVAVLLGLILPLGLTWIRSSGGRGFVWDLTQRELLSPLPGGVLLLLALAAVYLRFHQLTTLSKWPGADEAANAYYALELAKEGKWQWTYLFTGMPPLYVWLLGACFKVFGVSLTTLWGLPAFLSVLTLPFVFLGARNLFSQSFSVILTALTAFSFWPLYVARFSVQGQLMVFWMAVLFFLLSLFQKQDGWKVSKWAGIGLGFWAGTGFYTYTSWIVVALAVTGFILRRSWVKGQWGLFLQFIFPGFLLFLPLGWSVIHRGGGNFSYVLQNPFGSGWPGLNDLASFFWGSRLPPNLFAYRPFWGGFLNPVLGAACLYGLWMLLITASSPKALGGLFFLLMLPGFLTGGLDSFRVIQVLPLLLLGAALGLTAFLSSFAFRRHWVAVGTLLALSVGLDSYHLFGVYGSLWTQPKDNWFAIKSVERMRAFGILKELGKKEGPGLILSELVPDTYDQSLEVMDFPFNAAENPHLTQARWAAILINVHYQPYLSQVFPGGRNFWLASDAGFPDGGLTLYVIPLPCSKPEVLDHWVQLDRSLSGLTDLVFDNRDWRPRTPVTQSLFGLFPVAGEDRFLQACLWEKIAENEYWDHHYDAQVTALREAIEKGLSMAHLYNDLGALYLRHHRYSEAREAFWKATHGRPDHTSAAAGLAALDAAEKTGQIPKD